MPAVVGFIGLGLMGSGFTKRLVDTGHRVVGYDLDQPKCEAAEGSGVKIAASPVEVANQAEFVGVCVATSRAVEDVVLGGNGIMAAHSLAGKVIADFSTTDIETTHRIAEALTTSGGRFIDAPVSGGPGAAASGTLAILAGGSPANIAAARPVLELLGSLSHMGDVGSGQATKLVNQALCLANYCVVAEGLRIAEALGVDLTKIPAALAAGLADSAVLQSVFPRMVEEDYRPRGYVRQILKDLEMVHDAVRPHHLALPMTTQATTMFRMLVGRGKSELDGAAVVTLLPKPRG